MRILHILNHIRKTGNGIVNVGIDLACMQAKSGHDVSVASIGGEYETLLAQYGVKHYPLDQSHHPAQLLQAAKHYRQLVQKLQPEIVHTHMMTGTVLAWALRGTASYRTIATVHNEFQKSSILMGLADCVIAVSDAVANAMVRRGIPKQKVRVVCNGTIGTPRFQRIEMKDADFLCHPAIVTVAGMYDRKGIAELIEAFAQVAPQFPAAHLYLVGNGPDRSKFEQQAQATEASDRIHFEGFQPEPFRYLKSADIFVLASRREPFGLVLSEAREAGCAMIATNVDGTPEALEQGAAGILVPPMDSAAIAAALTRLLSNLEELKDWQRRAQQNLEWLSVARVNQETLAVYHEATGCPAIPSAVS